MNEAFIIGFFEELEKRAFFGKQQIGAFQRSAKGIQKGLNKAPQIETIPVGGLEERPVKPGSVLESAKSMAGDVARKVKTLKKRHKYSIRGDWKWPKARTS